MTQTSSSAEYVHTVARHQVFLTAHTLYAQVTHAHLLISQYLVVPQGGNSNSGPLILKEVEGKNGINETEMSAV